MRDENEVRDQYYIAPESNNEAEKHLNFNLVPSKKIQKKIDYFLTPYNKHKMFTKYMSFGGFGKEWNQNLSENWKEKWVRISHLILGSDKKAFRKTLFSINNKLYIEMGKNLNWLSSQYLDYEELQKLAKLPSESRNNPLNSKITYLSI